MGEAIWGSTGDPYRWEAELKLDSIRQSQSLSGLVRESELPIVALMVGTT